MSTIELFTQGRTVTLKMKTVNFEVKSRAVTLPYLMTTKEDLYKAASDLLAAEVKACAPNPLCLRLMGQCSKFIDRSLWVSAQFMDWLLCVSTQSMDWSLWVHAQFMDWSI